MCRVTRRPKVAYAHLTEAWIHVLGTFVDTGVILTPYYCIGSRTLYAELHRFPHPNPWRFHPVMMVRISLRSTKRRSSRNCHRWHLTRSTRHLLPRAQEGNHDY